MIWTYLKPTGQLISLDPSGKHTGKCAEYRCHLQICLDKDGEERNCKLRKNDKEFGCGLEMNECIQKSEQKMEFIDMKPQSALPSKRFVINFDKDGAQHKHGHGSTREDLTLSIRNIEDKVIASFWYGSQNSPFYH